MRAFFSFTAVGLLIAALCGVALSWDGAAYLFRALDNQTPFTPNGRLINWPLHLPVILASHITNDMPFLQFIFGFVYAGFPILMLLAAWWIVREQAPSLFIWAAFGISLGMLPGKIFFVSEANLAVQLVWPIILAVLVGLQRKHVPLVIVLTIGLYNTHPIAIVFLVLVAVLALGMGLRDRPHRRWMWGWAAVFGLLALASGIGFVLFRSDYERQQSTLNELVGSFSTTLAGLPLLALGCIWVAAILVIGIPIVGRRWQGQRGNAALYLLTMLSIGVATTLLTIWAHDPHRWPLASLFSRWVGIVALTFMVPASVEGIIYSNALRERLVDHWPQRRRVIQVIAAASSLVLIVQSFAWLNLTTTLRATIDRSPWSCVSAEPIEWLAGTPLDNWTITQESILLQGRAPQRVMLTDDLCGSVTFTRGIPLDAFLGTDIVRTWNGGWFDLQPVREGITKELNAQSGCSFTLTTGWHRTETNTPYWWRWSDGRAAQIRVVLDRDATILLGGQIETPKAPNQIDIVVNGQRRASTTLTATGLRPLGIAPLSLQAGVNTIQLSSQNPPIPASPDGRPLGLSVANLEMTIDGTQQTCAFHP